MNAEALQQEIDQALEEVRPERVAHLTHVPRMRDAVQTVRHEHVALSHHLAHPEEHHPDVEERLARLRTSLAAIHAALEHHPAPTVPREFLPSFTGEFVEMARPRALSPRGDQGLRPDQSPPGPVRGDTKPVSPEGSGGGARRDPRGAAPLWAPAAGAL